MASILHIYVQPGAKQTGFAGWHGDRIKVRIKAIATDGQANQAVIRFFAQQLNIRKQDVEIVKGLKSRLKTLQLHVDEQTVQKLLASADCI